MPWVIKIDEHHQMDMAFDPEYFEDMDDAHQFASDLTRASNHKDIYEVMDDQSV